MRKIYVKTQFVIFSLLFSMLSIAQSTSKIPPKGGTNQLLRQKIEELMLYSIRRQKQLESQHLLLEKQQQEIKQLQELLGKKHTTGNN